MLFSQRLCLWYRNKCKVKEMNSNFWQFHGFNFRLFPGCFQSDLHYALEDYSAKPGVYIKYSQLQSLCLKTWVSVFISRSSRERCSITKGVFRNLERFKRKHLCRGLFFNKVAGFPCNFIKKETLAKVFSCEFFHISRNTFCYRTALGDWFYIS